MHFAEIVNSMELIPLCPRNNYYNKWSVNTTIFYRNYTIRYGSLDPPSGVNRLEIYEQIPLIL